MKHVQMFSELMAEELDRQFWGTIDPNLFHEIAENANSISMTCQKMHSLWPRSFSMHWSVNK